MTASPSEVRQSARSSTRRLGVALISTGAAAALALAAQLAPAEAAPARMAVAAPPVAPADDVEPTPAAGMTWLQGVLTDQAGTTIDNVNVEVWPADPAATSPVASNLTYAGLPEDDRHDSGVFRVEVPSGVAYRISLSTVSGAEDGDPFRMTWIGGGGPIMAREDQRAVQLAPSGRIVDFGEIQLARQGQVDSRTTAKATKRKVRTTDRARVKVAVRSPFVTRVTGRVTAKVGKKLVKARITQQDRGVVVVRLPRLKPGTYDVRARFLGSSTVAPSRAKPARLVVKRAR